jgi:hypothetical protein
MKYPKIEFRRIDALQDYYSDTNGDLYSVAKLVDDTKDLKSFDAPICTLNLSSEIWSGYNILDIAFHCKRVNKADLSKPIIIAWDGCIADGRHRVIKSIMQGKRTIKAVRMTWKPEPCKRAE